MLSLTIAYSAARYGCSPEETDAALKQMTLTTISVLQPPEINNGTISLSAVYAAKKDRMLEMLRQTRGGGGGTESKSTTSDEDLELRSIFIFEPMRETFNLTDLDFQPSTRNCHLRALFVFDTIQSEQRPFWSPSLPSLGFPHPVESGNEIKRRGDNNNNSVSFEELVLPPKTCWAKLQEVIRCVCRCCYRRRVYRMIRVSENSIL